MRRAAALAAMLARSSRPLAPSLTCASALAAPTRVWGGASFPRTAARSAHSRAVAVAAGRRPAVGFLEAVDDDDDDDESESEADPDAPVPRAAPARDALGAARRALGAAGVTAADVALAAALVARGVVTAGDVAALTPAKAAALGVPPDVAAAARTVVEAKPTHGRRRAAAPAAPASPSPPLVHTLHAPSPNAASLLGAAAASADRTLAAPPTDPRWAARAGDAPPPVDAAVRAVLARRAPRADRFFHGNGEFVRVTRREGGGRADPYTLAPADVNPRLAAQLASFHRFWTARFPGQQQAPIAKVTASKYDDVLRRALGWAVRVKGVDAATLSLSDLLPSSGRDGAAPAMEYAAWLTSERGVTPHTEGLAVRALLAAAKFLYHADSTARPADGDKPYADLPLVRELRAMSRDARSAGRRAPRVADEGAKWLEWGEYLDLVAELRAECAALEERGRARAPAAVAWSLQKYLMFAILACVPDRQRTLRELEVGRTLFFRGGRWEIRHGPGDYKTGRAYGDRPPLVLSPSLNDELGAFLSTWRACLRPTHGRVFTCKNGAPLTTQAVHRVFERAAFRITGKKLNPHLVRDMIVTHLRGSGDATERELEALALYMGHSLDMQRSTYDRRTVADKVEPAVALLERLGGGGGGGGGGG